MLITYLISWFHQVVSLVDIQGSNKFEQRRGISLPNTSMNDRSLIPSRSLLTLHVFIPSGNVLTQFIPSGNVLTRFSPSGNVLTRFIPSGNVLTRFISSGNVLIRFAPSGNVLLQLLLLATTDVLTRSSIISSSSCLLLWRLSLWPVLSLRRSPRPPPPPLSLLPGCGPNLATPGNT